MVFGGINAVGGLNYVSSTCGGELGTAHVGTLCYLAACELQPPGRAFGLGANWVLLV